MALFGIPYMGSKSAIAIDIIKKLPSGNRFVDLFGGGFSMTHCAMLSGKYNTVYYNEYNHLIPPLIEKAINGEYNYNVFKPEFITREKFNELKDKDGYVKYIWSFSNKGTNYLFSKEIEQGKKALHNFVVFGTKDDFIKTNMNDIDKYITPNITDIQKRRLLLKKYFRLKFNKRCDLQQLERLQQLQQLQQLERLELNCGSYEEYIHQDGDVVYCDPPYEGTADYNEKVFNFKKFYDWVDTRPYPVYFSSYNNISDKRFSMVWACGKVSLMGGASNVKKYECLYCNKVALMYKEENYNDRKS